MLTYQISSRLFCRLHFFEQNNQCILQYLLNCIFQKEPAQGTSSNAQMPHVYHFPGHAMALTIVEIVVMKPHLCAIEVRGLIYLNKSIVCYTFIS